MNYEQKYKEALERAKDMMSYKEVRREDMEYLFPELKESTDEGIRESIAGFLKTISSLKDGQTVSNEDFDTKVILEWVAWLKKQGEQKPAEWHIEDEQNLNACLGYIPDEFLKRWLKDIIHIKYDKPIDKVESKFHEGDWIVYNRNDHSRKIMQIYDIRDNRYYFNDNIHFSWSVKECDEKSHLWTIKDAKDGDVLVNGSNIFIFHFINDTRLMGYCHVNTDNGRFYDDIGKNECFCLTDAVVTPATKDQRDTLEKEMLKARYKWNEDTKELINL